jgi:hypothetical protein
MLAIPCQAKTIYVDDDANGLNDGSSWQNAYKYLRDALFDSRLSTEQVEICVAQGIYKPNQSIRSPLLSEFRIYNVFDSNIILKGGYAGFGTPNPNERDIKRYQTILSGDLNGNDVEVIDPCDLLTEPTRNDNSRHVVFIEYKGTVMLDGLTITGGNANGLDTGSGVGGGIINYGDGRNNINPLIFNCTFTRNSARGLGGAIFLNPSWSSPRGIIANCIFTCNYATYGGAIYADWVDKLMVYNSTFAGNSAIYGGGIYLQIGVSSTQLFEEPDKQIVRIDNDTEECVFNPIIKNCIFHSNADREGMSEYAQIDGYPRWSIKRYPYLCNNKFVEVCLVSYSCIQGWSGGGIGNINGDPCFANPNNVDYHLKSQAGRWVADEGRWTKDELTSPCIDAGDPASPIGLEPFPNGGIINMGAYGGTEEASKSYFGKPPCETIVAGDINGDCIVNINDFALIAFHWLEDNRP